VSPVLADRAPVPTSALSRLQRHVTPHATAPFSRGSVSAADAALACANVCLPIYGFFMGAGLANFASSIGTLAFISFSTMESRPSSHA